MKKLFYKYMLNLILIDRYFSYVPRSSLRGISFDHSSELDRNADTCSAAEFEINKCVKAKSVIQIKIKLLLSLLY